MNALSKAIAREDLMHLARVSGATNLEGGNPASGPICFTPAEFETFIEKLLAHQKAAAEQYLQAQAASPAVRAALDGVFVVLAEKLGVAE